MTSRPRAEGSTTVRLARTAGGYGYAPLGATITRTTMGAAHTTGGVRTWWEVEIGGRIGLYQSLDDVRVTFAALVGKLNLAPPIEAGQSAVLSAREENH